MTSAGTMHQTGSLLLPAALLAVLSLVLAFETHALPLRFTARAVAMPETAIIPAGNYDFRPGGDFIQRGVAVSAPLQAGRRQAALEIMRYQVSAADYLRCVVAGMCPPAHPRHTGIGTVPAVGVSFNDAHAYADWLSQETGVTWRLPTLAEWDFAADGLAAKHGVVATTDGSDPSDLWLQQFDAQSNEKLGTSPQLKPLGAFGTNGLGVADMGGNIWEWTSTCNSRTRLASDGTVLTRVESCGVKLLEGRHRMPMSGFVQDAKGGACSMGLPPDNLGFRLVREPNWYERAARFASSLLGKAT